MKQSVRKSVENDLTEQMSEDRPGDFNQAMMELGAVVCVPNGAAKCEECPLGHFCLARKHGTVEELPVKAPKKARTIEQRTVLVIQDGEMCIRDRRGTDHAERKQETGYRRGCCDHQTCKRGRFL